MLKARTFLISLGETFIMIGFLSLNCQRHIFKVDGILFAQSCLVSWLQRFSACLGKCYGACIRISCDALVSFPFHYEKTSYWVDLCQSFPGHAHKYLFSPFDYPWALRRKRTSRKRKLSDSEKNFI